ncbi:hypothetical protein FB451DRAFT_1291279 [Mycena latifolia]|nr:hypothetical protein FB451DRAFT_1291262 [Mycena latifolia]KAJ7446713.1 hypothetical protein FB451DRAFT_1291279 [Mycena latifolia]
MSSRAARVTKALLAQIESPDYSPGWLPFLDAQSFNSLRTPPTSEDPIPLCDVYAGEGKGVMKYVIFKIIVDAGDLLYKPAEFIESITYSVICPDILLALLEKLDARSVENGVGLADVQDHFLAFVGAHWEQAFQDTEESAKWLRPIFDPLVRAASAAYDNPKAFKAPKAPKKRLSTKAKEMVEVRKSFSLLLLQNLERIQHENDNDIKPAPQGSPKPIMYYSPPAVSPFSWCSQVHDRIFSQITSFDLLSRDLSPLAPAVIDTTASRTAGPHTPSQEAFMEFFMWSEIPSPSRLEEELGVPSERPAGSIANRDLVATRTLCNLSVDQNVSPPGAGPATSPLLPAIELSTAKTVRDKAGGADRVAGEPSQSNLGVPLPKVPGPSEASESPATADKTPRSPLTPRNR